jgi:hypothetical protein
MAWLDRRNVQWKTSVSFCIKNGEKSLKGFVVSCIGIAKPNGNKKLVLILDKKKKKTRSEKPVGNGEFAVEFLQMGLIK